MRKCDGVRVHDEKGRWRVYHRRKSDGVRVHHEKKKDGVRVNHKKERWSVSSP